MRENYDELKIGKIWWVKFDELDLSYIRRVTRGKIWTVKFWRITKNLWNSSIFSTTKILCRTVLDYEYYWTSLHLFVQIFQQILGLLYVPTFPVQSTRNLCTLYYNDEKLVLYGANVWWGKILTNLTNQSCIVKIFPINILHFEYKSLSASAYNLWPTRACMRTEQGTKWRHVCLILHD